MKIRFLGILSFLFLTSLTAQEKPAFIAKEYPKLETLVGWNQDLIQMHLKLYRGYVQNASDLSAKIEKLSKDGLGKSYEFGALKRRLGWEFDGMRLHELYFDNLGALGEPSPLLTEKLIENFGSFASWKQDFIDTGLIRGIGWVILYEDSLTGKLVNAWVNEHDVGHFVLGKVLVVMDVFEHAYITQFALDKGKYIELFFASLNWDVVNARYTLIKGQS